MSSRTDWMCPRGCGLQFKSRDKCRDCPATRPGAPVPQVRPGDWKCPRCGDSQFARNEVCRSAGCNTPKPATQAAKPTTAAPPPPLRAGDWLCAKCNDVQFASRNQCRKCGTSKPAVDNPDGDLEGMCLICNERVRNAGLLHGDSVHTVTCIECAGDLMKSASANCPMCRQPIEKVLKTYN